MSVRSGQVVTKEFTTRRFDTGVATNADSTPTGTLYINGTADSATVTVTNQATGKYKAAVTLPTLSIGDIVELCIAATVNSITDNGVIWYDTKDLSISASGAVDAALIASQGSVTFSAWTVTGPVSATNSANDFTVDLVKVGGQGFTSSNTGNNFALLFGNANNLTTLTLDSIATAANVLAAWTTPLAESYATDGAAFSPAQALYMLWSMLAEKGVVGTTMTCKKLDGTTTSMTFSLSDATNPTSITRAT